MSRLIVGNVRMAPWALCVLLICVVVTLVVDRLAQAAAGDLDQGFGSGGKVTADFFSTYTEDGMAVVVQSDGRIVVGGTIGNVVGNTVLYDYGLLRFNSDGALDSTFGVGGKVTTDITNYDLLQSLAIQSDGKIVAVGTQAIVRYNSDGSLDATFGNGGVTGSSFVAYDVAIQSDGRIVTGGSTGLDFAIARYTTNGLLDNDFGTGGLVTTDFGGGVDIPLSLSIQADGKIVAAGYATFDPPTNQHIALARYHSDGSLDSSFGTGGRVSTAVPFSCCPNQSYAQAEDVVIQDDLRIVAAGLSYDPVTNYSITLARYNTDGTLDPTFGNSGVVTTPNGACCPHIAIARQTDNKFIVSGHTNSSGTASFALWRYLLDGSLDTSFGMGGQVTTDFGTNSVANDVTIQPDGKVVTAGTVSYEQYSKDFAVVRYLNPATFTLSVSKTGSGSGTVFSAPAGINCGAMCSAAFDAGAVVTLTAAPDGTSNFTGWSGACTGTGSCAVTMDAAKSVAATFTRAQYTLTVTKTGNGNGTVTSSPAGINCGATCSAAFNAGTLVSLTATPNATSTFLGWSGGCSGTGGCSVTMNAATSVTATFTARAADLSVTKSDSPDPVTVNTSMTYTIMVTNNGPDRATGVTVTDTLPAGVAYVSAVSTRGSCSQSAGTVTCVIGNLRDGRNATVTIVVTPTVVANLSNTACVSANQGDPNPGNNCATAGTVVNAPTANTPAGSNVNVPLGNGLTVTFSNVSTAGTTSVTIVTSGPPPPTSFRLGTLNVYYDVNTTATFSGPITVCFNYDDSQFSRENRLRLYHHTGGNWQNVTTTVDTTTNVICGTTTSLSPFIVVEPDLANLVNISTRARVETGDNVMIGGFWISGSVPKTVLVRARGGSLGGPPFNNPGVLANPTMQLYSGSTVIAQNDNWQTTDPLCVLPAEDCGDVAQISATGLDPCQPNPGQSTAPPGCTQESALVMTLPPGGYTAIVSGVGGASGMGLVEVFEVDSGTALLINISTRSRVQTGDNVMIGGFWVGGTTPKNVLIRARGGSLGGPPFNNPGVLANPTMQLYSGSTVVAQNNDWGTFDATCVLPCVSATPVSNTLVPGLTPCEPNPGQSTAPPGCNQESAILVTLDPGGYTAIVSGVGGTSGMGLVEVFEVP